jgi:hypothetical protein
MVRHYDPRAQVVRAATAFAIQQRRDEHFCHSRVSQPLGAELASVQLSIEVGETLAGIWVVLQ